MKRFYYSFLLIVCLLGAPLGVAQQEDPLPVTGIVYVNAGDIWIAAPDGSHARRLADGKAFDPLFYQPDMPTYHMPFVVSGGRQVYFANWFDDALWQVSLEDENTPAERYEDKLIYQPFGFTDAPDGEHIGVVVLEDDGTLSFEAISIADGAVARHMRLPFIGGCGGGPYLPDAQAYDMQAGSQGNGLLLAWVDNQILSSRGCNSQGVQVTDLTSGETSVLDADLRRARLSPDGQYVAGLTVDALRIIDRVTGDEVGHHDDRAGYDQLAWTPGGNLLFTTVQIRDEMPFVPQDILLANEMLFNLPVDSVPLYEVTLYHLDVAQGEARRLWTSTGKRGIPALVASDDMVYFSAVDDLSAMIEALNTGAGRDEIIAAWPGSDIYRLSLAGDSATELIIEGGESPVLVRAH